MTWQDPSAAVEQVQARLTTQHLGRTLHCLEEVDSTNSDLARRAGQAPHGTVVWAERQSAGRGRRGRSWYGVPGKSLCFSLLLCPSAPGTGPRVPHPFLSWIPLASALGVATGIAVVTGITPQLKWPNDVLIDGKKLGGLLCESLAGSDGPSLVIGIGLNVALAPEDYPVDLRDRITSLTAHTDKPIAREALLAALLNVLEPRLDAVCSQQMSEIRRDYRQACSTLGRHVRVELAGQPSLEGLAESIADSGALMIRPDAAPATATADSDIQPVAVMAGDVVHLR